MKISGIPEFRLTFIAECFETDVALDAFLSGLRINQLRSERTQRIPSALLQLADAASGASGASGSALAATERIRNFVLEPGSAVRIQNSVMVGIATLVDSGCISGILPGEVERISVDGVIVVVIVPIQLAAAGCGTWR